MRRYIADFARGLQIAARHPALVAFCAVAICLGIAAPTTIFSIVHGLTRDLPFDHGGRIVYVMQTDPVGGERDVGLTVAQFVSLSREQHALEELGAYRAGVASLEGRDGTAERYASAEITANTLDQLRVKPTLGRMFTIDDEVGDAPVVVISTALWVRRFGGDPHVIGTTISLNGHPTTVVAILPEGFQFPFRQDLWVPLRRSSMAGDPATPALVKVFGRLRDGTSIARADMELSSLAKHLDRDPLLGDRQLTTRVVAFKESQIEPSDIVLFQAMVLVVSTVLLVACANVGNLLLAHIAARSLLFAVKTALGASRASIIREVLAESTLIAVVGGAAGIGLAALGILTFNRSVGAAIPNFWMTISLDRGVVGFSVALILVAAVCAGLIPAYYASRTDPATALRSQERGMRSRGMARATATLLTGQIALSCCLLTVAGVMTKGALGRSRGELTINPDEFISAQVDFAVLGERDRAIVASEASRRLRADARVAASSLTSILPGFSGAPTRMSIVGTVYRRAEDRPRVRTAVVSPDYFAAVGVTLHSGRAFEESDDLSHPRVAMVNEAFARAHFTSTPALGARVQLKGADSGWVTVIGITSNVGSLSTDPAAAELLYLPLAQQTLGTTWLLVRKSGSVTSVSAAIRQAVHGASTIVPVTRLDLLSDEMNSSRQTSRALASIFAACGLAGLLLAMVGVYGVTSMSARRRVREFGIRGALGASPVELMRLVIASAVPPLAIGLGAGCAVALLAGPALQGTLFGANPRDPQVFAVVLGTLSLVMLTAALRPALWAARTAPSSALRQ